MKKSTANGRYVSFKLTKREYLCFITYEGKKPENILNAVEHSKDNVR